ncbi:tryptophan synthase beta subunit-like PLP-dependent enzyme [Ephemerocybe angulata]|uniref:L-serine ammonia-lyase n=1 Tax=Ephemerocybe angulata TaxID=980116 RepID=A0A8H6MH87_9AGAR|nr:tryptophan synthase beta subunit-like PLP-dependent enzyme [Tulosesus angulatus]
MPEDSKAPLWTETPLRYSNHISQTIGANAYLKLENLQPSFSFKYRGVSHFIEKKKSELGDKVHSACAARKLNCRCTVFLPDWVSESTLSLLKSEGAEVVIGGALYADALKGASELVANDTDAVMVPAYNDPIIWEGHSSMIKEIHTQIPKKPSAIFCSVGGAGLLGGILEGCKAVGWEDVPIVAIETIGSDCFYHSMSLNKDRFNATERKLPPGVDLVHDEANDVYLAHFNSFSSKAFGSLGASEPAPAIVRMALDWPGGVKCITVPDGISMETLALFANDQKMLVELACSTTLVPAYHAALFNKILGPSNDKGRTVVFVVCGGFKISLSEAGEYQNLLNTEPRGNGETWTVKYDDGSLFEFEK